MSAKPHVDPLPVAAGRIDPQISWRSSEKDVTAALLGRRLHGPGDPPRRASGVGPWRRKAWDDVVGLYGIETRHQRRLVIAALDVKWQAERFYWTTLRGGGTPSRSRS